MKSIAAAFFAISFAVPFIPFQANAQSTPSAGVVMVLKEGVWDKDTMEYVDAWMLTLEGCESAGEKWIGEKSKYRKGWKSYNCFEVK